MRLRPGFPVFAVGELTGMVSQSTTQAGDSLARADYVIPPAGVRQPMPVGHVQEWLAGTLCDARGAFCAYVYVPAAAVDPHAA